MGRIFSKPPDFIDYETKGAEPISINQLLSIVEKRET